MGWLASFDHLSKSTRIQLIVVTLVIGAILLTALRSLDAPLRTQAAPQGIVSFELAKNYEVSRQILDSWSNEAKVYAALSLGLDYLFLVVYALFISLSCIQVGTALRERASLLFPMAQTLARAQFLAAILDAIENWALIHLLLNASDRWLPGLARWCATVKFSIVGAGLIFIGGGLLAIGIKSRLKKSG